MTIGVEFGSRIVTVGPPASHSSNPAFSNDSSPIQKRMKLSLWDTAGQETYKSVTRSYFRGASGALLVFDITRRSTFENATSWLQDLRQIAEDGIVVVLVGNKRDLVSGSVIDERKVPAEDKGSVGNLRAVSSEEAEEWCRANKVMRYVETSAKSGEGVERAFLDVAEKIHENIEKGKYDLNDRRSGVKGPGAGGGGIPRAGGIVRLRNDAAGGNLGTRGWTGGCC